MVIAALGTVFAAAYLLWLYQRTAFGEPTAEFAGDAHTGPRRRRRGQRRTTTTAPTSTTSPSSSGSPGRRCWSRILVLGVYPQLLFKIFDPAVTHLVDRLGQDLSP